MTIQQHATPRKEEAKILQEEKRTSKSKTAGAKSQKVVFNLVGQYATEITFIHSEIRMPFKHIPKQIQQARSTIQEARDRANGSANFHYSTIAALEAMSITRHSQEASGTRCFPKPGGQTRSVQTIQAFNCCLQNWDFHIRLGIQVLQRRRSPGNQSQNQKGQR